MTSLSNVFCSVVVISGLVFQGLTGAIAAPNCACRGNGQSYQVGKCACLSLGGKFKQACCKMVLNNPAWIMNGDECPMAWAPPENSAGSGMIIQHGPERLQASLMPAY